MVAAVGGYALVHYLVKSNLQPRGELEVLPQLLLGFAIVNLGLALWWFRWVVAQVSAEVAHAQVQPLNDAQRTIFRQRLFVSVIVICALLETPAIFGLVHSLLGLSANGTFELLALLSLLGFVVLRVRGFPIVMQLFKQLEPGAAAAGA